jgi:hypothetical protein
MRFLMTGVSPRWVAARSGRFLRRQFVNSGLALLVCVLINGASAHGQQRDGVHTGQRAQATAEATGSKAHKKPPRFSGWTRARQDGPEAFEKFSALLRRKAPVAHVQTGANPEAGVSGRGALEPRQSARSIAQTTMPTKIPGIVSRPSLPAGAIPTASVAGDFNNDGKLDWIVANGGDNSLFVYLGNGDGTAQLPTIVQLIGTAPLGLATADVNGDGKLDLVVVEADTQTVGVLLGNGDGTFQAETQIYISSQPISVTIADVNKDGKLDLVVGVVSAGAVNSGPFAVLLGTGGGSFAGPIFASNGNGLSDQNGYSVSVADVNGDGIPDVLCAGTDASGGTAQIYIGKGDGTFTAGQALNTTDIATGVFADITGDGCPDAIIATIDSLVYVFPGDCHGKFDDTTNLQLYGMGDPVYGLAVADINGDGKPDLVTGGFPFDPGIGAGALAGNLLGVRLNDGTGHLGALTVYAGDPGMFSLVVADLKGNGFPEVVTANQDFNSVSVYQNDGSGGFGAPSGGYIGYLNGSTVGTANPMFSQFLVTDIEGNGSDDILQIQYPSGGSQAIPGGSLAVLLNQGNGKFAPPVHSSIFNAGDLIVDYVVANFRNPGKGDLLAEVGDEANNLQPSIAFAPNMGNGQFGVATITALPAYPSGSLASGLGVGDFNGDGKLDAVIVAQGGTQNNEFSIVMLLGKGDGTFRQSTQSLTGPILPFSVGIPKTPAPVVVEDVNGDGKMDLLIWFQQTGEVVEFLGNGDGTFQAPTVVLQNVQELAMRDLNHDGLIDLVQVEGGPFASGQTLSVNVYLGQPGGTFSAPTNYAPFAGQPPGFSTGATPDSQTAQYAQLVGDFNGDGNPDIAIFQTDVYSNQYVQFLTGKGDGTFVPNYDLFPLGEMRQDTPTLTLANLLGDGKDVFLFEDDFGATYHTIEAATGPSFQIQMDEAPVISGSDALRVNVNTSSADTVIQLTSSDPDIQIAQHATVPAGQLSIDVPFNILSNFNASKVFSITVQSGSESHVTYNFVAPPGSSSFAAQFVGDHGSTVSVARGSTTDLVNLAVASQGEAAATFQVVGCLGLPAGATCNFMSPSFAVPVGTLVDPFFSIATTDSTATGSYPFQVQITDGAETLYPSGTLNIGDFTVSVLPASLTASAGTIANYTYSIGSIAGFTTQITITCENLPSGAQCPTTFVTPGTTGPLQVTVGEQTAPGTYTFTLSGNTGNTTHTATAQLKVVDIAVATLGQTQANFSSTLIGATSVIPIALQNTGSGPLDIQSVAATTSQGASGTFTQSNNCGASLAVNAQCTLSVTFAPTAVGAATGSLQITDNAGGSPQTIPLSGSGGDFNLAVASGGATSATITAGQTATYKLTVQPRQFQGSITLTCAGAPSETNCVVSPAQIPLVNGAAAPFQVQLATTAPSNGELRIIRIMPPRPGVWSTAILVLAFVLWGGFIFRERRQLLLRLGVSAILAAALLPAGCGGGGGGGGGGTGPQNFGTPPGTYTITITAQASGATRTINLILVAQ